MRKEFIPLIWIGKDGALSKIHELVREMRVAQVMTKNVYTVSPDAPMREVKKLMRVHRISGLPVLEDGKMVGVVSIEDLILALESAQLDVPVREFMTVEGLIVAREHEPVVEALRRLEQTGVGRLPVLNEDGVLVGIVTRGDIMLALLNSVQSVYDEAEELQSKPRYFFETLESHQTSLILRYEVAKGDFIHGGEASAKLKRALLRIGASSKLARRVAIAAYEAEMNLVIHTDNGGHVIAEIHPSLITVLAQDDGPGIPDVELARQPGYSTASPEIREMGFGAGMGLANINRCTDEMSIWSTVGVGTRVQMSFEVPPEEAGH
jgi:CBS domain-containing protein/anti-sigma regulatory factor (Ser/Thr protein kinase)